MILKIRLVDIAENRKIYSFNPLYQNIDIQQKVKIKKMFKTYLTPLKKYVITILNEM